MKGRARAPKSCAHDGQRRVARVPADDRRTAGLVELCSRGGAELFFQGDGQ